MKIPANLLFFRSKLEVALFIVFVLYIVFPVPIPEFLANMIDSPIGMAGIFCITVFLFLYTHPILGILYLFVAYELIRRSSKTTGKTAYIQYTPTQETRNANMKAMNVSSNVTSLEEEIVSSMAPIGKSESSQFIDSSFKPVAEDNHNAVLL